MSFGYAHDGAPRSPHFLQGLSVVPPLGAPSCRAAAHVSSTRNRPTLSMMCPRQWNARNIGHRPFAAPPHPEAAETTKPPPLGALISLFPPPRLMTSPACCTWQFTNNSRCHPCPDLLLTLCSRLTLSIGFFYCWFHTIVVHASLYVLPPLSSDRRNYFSIQAGPIRSPRVALRGGMETSRASTRKIRQPLGRDCEIRHDTWTHCKSTQKSLYAIHLFLAKTHPTPNGHTLPRSPKFAFLQDCGFLSSG